MKKIREIGEFGLIERLTEGFPSTRGGTHVGVGDDASVVDVSGDRPLLITCDAQVEAVHFRREWSKPKEIGFRAAAINLSDIAAMGGDPAFALVSLGVPENEDMATLEGVYDGLREGFAPWNVEIVGGNVSRSLSGLVIDVTLLGFGDAGQVLLRSGAETGDVLCVTGELGLAATGLAALSENRVNSELVGRDLTGAFLAPTPRVAEGRILARSGVTACIDISDGLLSDAGHLAKKSGVVLNVDLERLPISPITVKNCPLLRSDPEEMALKGGEDYELLFTMPKDGLPKLAAEIEQETHTRVSIIGEVVAGDAAVRFERNGQEIRVDGGGFDHFGK